MGIARKLSVVLVALTAFDTPMYAVDIVFDRVLRLQPWVWTESAVANGDAYRDDD